LDHLEVQMARDDKHAALLSAGSRQPGEPVSREPLLTIDEGGKPERADAARNRRLLLEAASRIVHDRGIEALSMDAVAAEAGVGVGTVYRRFGDRARLAYALIDNQERDFQAAFISGPPPLGPGAAPEDRLRAFLHRSVDRLSVHAHLIATAEAGAEHYRVAAHTLQRRHVEMLIAAINPDLDAHYLADALLAVLSAKLYRYQSLDQNMTNERIKAGLDQLLEGILQGTR
jgi:AcrR family transcriptional regulator